MADANLSVIIQQLKAEKGVDEEVLLEAIRGAIETAARKSYSPAADITVDIDLKSKKPFNVFEILEVVEEVEDEALHISLEDARNLNPQATLGDRLKVPTEPRDFGRIAAQTAKQVIIQKMKDAERDNVYEEYKQREGELITGVVKRVSHGKIIVSLGRAEAIIPPNQQSQRESFKPGDRIRGVLVRVEKTQRGAELEISRATPDLVRLLFDLEVPEIYDGTVELRAVARDAGVRTKIAVWSNDNNVDPVGACVGMKGSRVRAVVEELCGEKIDIVRYSEDVSQFCSEALNPADILNITLDPDNKSLLVIVPEDQLSLAIGKRGQNARLASRLIGWNIDIKSDVQIMGGDESGAEGGSLAALDAVMEAEAAAKAQASSAEGAVTEAEAGSDAQERMAPNGSAHLTSVEDVASVEEATSVEESAAAEALAPESGEVVQSSVSEAGPDAAEPADDEHEQHEASEETPVEAPASAADAVPADAPETRG